MRIVPLGDSALSVELGTAIDETTHRRVVAAAGLLAAAGLDGVTDVVPAYTTVTLHYDIGVLHRRAGNGDPVARLRADVAATLTGLPRAVASLRTPRRQVEIPVCYGGEFGPDLETVATRARLSAREVIARHQAADYRVYAVGFVPGFAYLAGLPPELATPRRSSPRVRVTPGSLGIAGTQTGMYPVETPGGWNLIGRTPVCLFDPDRDPPTRLLVGERVRFRAISVEEFNRWPKT